MDKEKEEMSEYKKLLTMSKIEVQGVLSDAMDRGDWHSPSVEDLAIDNRYTSNACIAGSFKSSLHNTYHGEVRRFEINKNSVRIWSENSVINPMGRLTQVPVYRPIYNMGKIVDKLLSLPDVGINEGNSPETR